MSEISEILAKFGESIDPHGWGDGNIQEAEQAIEAYIARHDEALAKYLAAGGDSEYVIVSSKDWRRNSDEYYAKRFEAAIGEDESPVELWDEQEKPSEAIRRTDGRNQLRAEARKRWQND